MSEPLFHVKLTREHDLVLYYDGKRPETLEQAWEITLKKWEMIVSLKGKEVYNIDSSTCGLCMFYTPYEGDEVECNRCPIQRRTGQLSCIGTPYYSFVSALDDEMRICAANKELAFLRDVYAEWKERQDE